MRFPRYAKGTRANGTIFNLPHFYWFTYNHKNSKTCVLYG